MAYWLGVYMPTGYGLMAAEIYDAAGNQIGFTGPPLGTATACYRKSNLNGNLRLVPHFAIGLSLVRWVVNIDGAVSYQTTAECVINVGNASNVQVRPEVSGSPLAAARYAVVIFDANGGTGGPKSTSGLTTGTTASVPTSPSPTRSGYTFKGWATSPTATTPTYPAGTTVQFSATTNGVWHYLYAVWEGAATTYYAYLAYNANGGTGAPSTHLVSGKTETFNAQISSVVPTREGYTFAGWWLYNIESYGTYQPGGLVPITGTAGSPSSTPHTLYAQWKKNASTGKVQIGNGYGFDSYTPYIWYNGAWHKFAVYVWYNSGWKKGT